MPVFAIPRDQARGGGVLSDRYWTLARWVFLGVVCIIHAAAMLAALSLHPFPTRFITVCATSAAWFTLGLFIWTNVRLPEERKTPGSALWLCLLCPAPIIFAYLRSGTAGYVPWLYACAATSLLVRFWPWRGMGYAGLLLLVLCGSVFFGSETNCAELFLVFLLVLTGFGATRIVYGEAVKTADELSRTRRSVGQMAETNVRLQNHAIQSREWLLNQERYRIAREIHDSLGHALTGMVVRLQVLETMIGPDPVKAMAETGLICNMAREALQETRAAVASLRDPVLSALRGPALWNTLCETFFSCTGVKVQTGIDERLDVSDTVNATLYRFIQEALTNAYRHGGASLVDVAVWRENDWLYARVSDNGRGALAVQSGFGIMGIRERLDDLGGKVAWRSEYGKGFDIVIKVPWQEVGGSE